MSNEVITKLKTNKLSAFEKSHEARNNSTNANHRAQKAFYNSVNSTMNNPNIFCKKEIWDINKVDEKSENFDYSPLNRK